MNTYKMFSKMLAIMGDPKQFFFLFSKFGWLDWMPDSVYLKLMFYFRLGYRLNLKNPRTFNEKLQWLKINDRKPEYAMMADKFEVRGFVERKIGKDYLIPLLGVWESFEDIDFSLLPDKFVLKATHDSGSIMFCLGKAAFDFDKARTFFSNALRKNFSLIGREYCYNVGKPRLIAEPYLSNESLELTDFKILCFNGKAKCLFACTERRSMNGLRVTFFDLEWNRLPFERFYPSSLMPINRPRNLAKMVFLAETLSKDIPFLRVDFYEVEGKVLFGELTFYPGGGFEGFTPPRYDRVLGKWLELPDFKKGSSG